MEAAPVIVRGILSVWVLQYDRWPTCAELRAEITKPPLTLAVADLWLARAKQSGYIAEQTDWAGRRCYVDTRVSADASAALN